MDNPYPAIANPSLADVERITAVDDPVIRNLQITQCYHELSKALLPRIGPSANWCTFATWASRQAGQTIRKEDLGRTLERLFTTEPATVQAAGEVAASAPSIGVRREARDVQRLAWRTLNPMGPLERSSEAVGRGNLKVFAEIGREFARFYAECLEDEAYDAGKIDVFCAGLRSGDPPAGQRYLMQAFRRYYQAFFEADSHLRSELLLLANLEIGFHEQARLQPEIAEALDVRLVDPSLVKRLLVAAIYPSISWPVYISLLLSSRLSRPTRFEAAVDALIEATRQQVRRLITETMMTIGFPHGVVLRLGDDLAAGFAGSLAHLTSPDLLALLAQIDPTPDSPRQSGVLDWSDLPDRLHFIADLFRCYQETANLFEPPFTPQQIAEIKAGRKPEGPL